VEPNDVVLGRVCLERGWLDPEELSACLAEAAALRPSPGAGRRVSPLSAVLVGRRLIPVDELEALRGEIARALASGPDPDQDRAEDLVVLEFLRVAGHVSEEQSHEALGPLRAPRPPHAPARLREILLERGHITLAALQEALHAARAPGTAVTCRSCRASSALVRYDPARVYLCKVCTGELVPSVEFAAEKAPETPPRAPPPAPDVVSAAPGFGKYASPCEIGRGGMGVVYKAWDEENKRWVALKIVRDSKRLEETTRYRREVEIARSLHHPNIVALYEVTQVGSRHLIAMEYVDGETLAGKRMAPGEASRLISTVARAVQYAHSRGIVHRDIKPQNIMVDRSGRPYLMDFGLAKSQGAPSSITAVGTAMGTPNYMAPEQAIGRSSRVDQRTDVYGLGAVIYELLTGRPPFRGANPLDVIRAVIYDEIVPPSEIDPSVPRALEAVVMMCLDRDKKRRYQTARHLAEALEAIAIVGS